MIVGVLVSVALGYMLMFTSPVEAGATGILLVFLLSYILSVVVLTFFIFMTHRVVIRLFYSDRTGHIADKVTFRRSYYFASILALGPILLVSLRSVGQVGVVELLLVGALLVVGCVYVSRQTS